MTRLLDSFLDGGFGLRSPRSGAFGLLGEGVGALQSEMTLLRIPVDSVSPHSDGVSLHTRKLGVVRIEFTEPTLKICIAFKSLFPLRFQFGVALDPGVRSKTVNLPKDKPVRYANNKLNLGYQRWHNVQPEEPARLVRTVQTLDVTLEGVKNCQPEQHS